MNEILIPILKIFAYTLFIVALVFLSKKLYLYSNNKNHFFSMKKNDSRLRIIEKCYIDKNAVLLLVKCDDDEILIVASQNNSNIIWIKKANE